MILALPLGLVLVVPTLVTIRETLAQEVVLRTLVQETVLEALMLETVLETLALGTTIWVCGRRLQNDQLRHPSRLLARKPGRVLHPRRHRLLRFCQLLSQHHLLSQV
jgi:hypothetical protein